MHILKSLIVAAALLSGTAQALLPRPSSGEVSMAILKQRQTNRIDIVRRAMARGSLAKRQGPSAIPIRCGAGVNSVPGSVFYLSGKVIRATNPSNPLGTKYYPYLSRQPATPSAGTVQVSRSASFATAFTFDANCNVHAIGADAAFEFYGLGVAQTRGAAVRMAPASVINANVQSFRPVCSLALDGILSCYTYFAPEGAAFCSISLDGPGGNLFTLDFAAPAVATNGCNILQFTAVQTL